MPYLRYDCVYHTTDTLFSPVTLQDAGPVNTIENIEKNSHKICNAPKKFCVTSGVDGGCLVVYVACVAKEGMG